MTARARLDRAAIGACGLLAVVVGMSLGFGLGALLWLAPAITAWWRAL